MSEATPRTGSPRVLAKAAPAPTSADRVVHDPLSCGTPTIRLMSLAALRDYKVGPFFAKLEGAGSLATLEELRCHVRL